MRVGVLTLNAAGRHTPPRGLGELPESEIYAFCIQELTNDYEMHLVPPVDLAQALSTVFFVPKPILSVSAYLLHIFYRLPLNMLSKLFGTWLLWLLDPVQAAEMKHEKVLENWYQIIEVSLGPQYGRIDTVHTSNISLIIYARHTLSVDPIGRGSVGCGIGGLLPNKGAAASLLYLRALDTRLLLISAHLAAHEGQAKRRNWDIDQVFSRLVLNDETTGTRTRLDAAHVILLGGDLNYRLNLKRQQFLEMCASGPTTWEMFAQHDELAEQLRHHQTLRQFHEGAIRFAPSYKLQLGLEDVASTAITDQVDLSLYSTKRLPAWCDRCLYWPTGRVRLESYTSRHLDGGSDHRPVCAVFDIHPGSGGGNSSSTASTSSGSSVEMDVKRQSVYASYFKTLLSYGVSLVAFCSYRCIPVVWLVIWLLTRKRGLHDT